MKTRPINSFDIKVGMRLRQSHYDDGIYLTVLGIGTKKLLMTDGKEEAALNITPQHPWEQPWEEVVDG